MIRTRYDGWGGLLMLLSAALVVALAWWLVREVLAWLR